MTITLPSGDADRDWRREAAIQWGWPLFFSGAIGCAITSYWLYYWAMYAGGDKPVLLADVLLCTPFSLLSCIGFIQVVTGATFNQLYKVWPSLNFWRRFSIVVFVTGTVYYLASFTYFLMSLTPTIEISGYIG